MPAENAFFSFFARASQFAPPIAKVPCRNESKLERKDKHIHRQIVVEKPMCVADPSFCFRFALSLSSFVRFSSFVGSLVRSVVRNLHIILAPSSHHPHIITSSHLLESDLESRGGSSPQARPPSSSRSISARRSSITRLLVSWTSPPKTNSSKIAYTL
jgi:hypothetical protein